MPALGLAHDVAQVEHLLLERRGRREELEQVIIGLRNRGRPEDAGAADALQWVLDRKASPTT